MASPRGQEDEVQLPREDQEGQENMMPGDNQEVAEDQSSLSSFLDDTWSDDDSDISTHDRPFAGKRSQESDEASFYDDLSLESFAESDQDSTFQFDLNSISSEDELSDDDWSTVDEVSNDEESPKPAEEEPTSLEVSNSHNSDSCNSSILELPPEVHQKILGYLSFHEVKLLTFSGDLMALGPFIIRYYHLCNHGHEKY